MGGKEGATWKTKCPSASWSGLPRRADRPPAGLAERTCRAAAQERSASPPPTRRDDRPGTNSYLVGDPATGFIAIDPPAGRQHLERLWRAAGGDIRMIVCTHSHP